SLQYRFVDALASVLTGDRRQKGLEVLLVLKAIVRFFRRRPVRILADLVDNVVDLLRFAFRDAGVRLDHQLQESDERDLFLARQLVELHVVLVARARCVVNTSRTAADAPSNRVLEFLHPNGLPDNSSDLPVAVPAKESVSINSLKHRTR